MEVNHVVHENGYYSVVSIELTVKITEQQQFRTQYNEHVAFPRVVYSFTTLDINTEKIFST